MCMYIYSWLGKIDTAVYKTVLFLIRIIIGTFASSKCNNCDVIIKCINVHVLQ